MEGGLMTLPMRLQLARIHAQNLRAATAPRMAYLSICSISELWVDIDIPTLSNSAVPVKGSLLPDFSQSQAADALPVDWPRFAVSGAVSAW
jgi:hypothetical protein